MLEFLRCLCNLPLTYVSIDVPHEDRAEETVVAALASLFLMLCVRGRQNRSKRRLRGICCLCVTLRPWGFSRSSVLVVSLPRGLETYSALKTSGDARAALLTELFIYHKRLSANISCTFLH